MAFSKSNLYPKDDQIISGFLKALGHPARVKIIRFLSKNGPCRVEDICKNHPISQPALSVHLSILRKAQLILYKERYPHTYYKIDGKTVTLAETYLTSFFRDL
jgi:ArsR family transcriptional regulator, arsenate/arsenite/antimonite-responsive transcriptional repressor